MSQNNLLVKKKLIYKQNNIHNYPVQLSLYILYNNTDKLSSTFNTFIIKTSIIMIIKGG